MGIAREYATSMETKKRIMDVCKHLFYEKGYTQTTYAEICKQANVHPGTITYHYGSKSKLGGILYQQVLDDYIEATGRLFPDEDELDQKLLANGIHHKLIFEDPAFRRFSSEYTTSWLQKAELNEYIDTSSKAFELTKRYVGEERATFLFVAFQGMDSYMERYITDNIDVLTYEQVFIYISEIYHPYLDRTELYARLEHAIALIDKLDVRFEDFRVYITEKK